MSKGAWELYVEELTSKIFVELTKSIEKEIEINEFLQELAERNSEEE